jgi:hypothetical protein
MLHKEKSMFESDKKQLMLKSGKGIEAEKARKVS